MTQPQRRQNVGRIAMVGAVIAALSVPMMPMAAHAAPDGVDGTGTSADPYQLDSPEDLFAMAEAINSDSGSYAASHIDLVADIDLEGQPAFSGITAYSGTLDGLGNSISNIEYTREGTDSNHLGFVRDLNGGTITNLTLDGVSGDNGSSTGFVSGLAVYSKGGTITGSSVLDAELAAPNGEKAGGLVAEADGGTITNNVVQGSITANEMPAGIAAYIKNQTTVTHNLVSADLQMLTPGGAEGNRGNDAGLIVAYPGNPNASVISNNVALDGSIAYEGKVDGFTGRIVGYTGYDGWTAEDNLANSAITISGDAVTGPGTKNQHGTDVAAAELAQQATYENLGWDFANHWSFDETLGHPVPKYTYSLAGQGTEEFPFEVGSEHDLEFLAEQLNSENPIYTEATHLILTADLDFTDREAFPGIDRFAGTLAGQGHTISNLDYAPSESSNRLGLIRELDGGAVRDLKLQGVTAQGRPAGEADEGDYVSGVAVIATDATIEGVSVVDAELNAPGAEKVAGLAAELRGESTVRNNWVDGEITAKKMPAGVASYIHDESAARENIVTATLETLADGGAGTRGINAGLIVAYPGSGNNTQIAENVAHSGEVVYSGTVPGFAGRILGYHQTEGDYRVPVLENNLANEEIPVSGAAVSGTATGQNGADTTAAALGEQATYEDLGWDFNEDWFFDAELGHPVPLFIMDGDRPNRITNTFYGDSQTQRAFTWYADLGEEGSVQVSTSREFEDPAVVEATQRNSQHGENLYQAVATDLAADERYYYRVGDPGLGIWSATGTFTTSDGDSDFTFLDLTDTQSQNADEADLSADTIRKAQETVPGAEFLVHNGDVVEQGGREQDWIDLFGASQDSLLDTTIAPASGNHDEATNSFVDHFMLEAPNGQDTATGAYYSFDYNKAHISVLNTNEDGSQAVSDEQIEWLRQDVNQARENGAEWIIVTMHKGLYTTANHLDDADIIAMRDQLVPVIDELDIDLVLQGHDHVMSRTKVLEHDPEGVEEAAVVETEVITEIVNGKRIEYSVSPDGTIYYLPNTAGAKHYDQAETAEAGIDLEAYLQLFDRTGREDTENFVSIDVTDGQLTVNVYDIRDQGRPRLFESFGIDREIEPVDAQIEALPAADALTAEDATAVAEVRAGVDALSSAQQGGLANLEALEEREARLRILTGAVSTDGEQVAWAATDATDRQTVSITNSTRSDFEDSPVRLEIENAGEENPDRIAFTTQDGVQLPYEVESWDPNGTSVVWVRVPELAAHAATTIWAYYGTDQGQHDPAAVWDEDYALVEHFGAGAGAVEAGEPLVDSTGDNQGAIVGDPLELSVEGGDGRAQFGATRLQYPGDVGGQQDRISISSVVSVTSSQLNALTDDAPIVAKESTTEDGQSTFWQGVKPGSNEIGTRLQGNSYEFDNADLKHNFGFDADGFEADGEPHLITQTYDGMTYSVFMDGQEVHAQMLEYRSTFGDPDVLTTIGDYFTNDGTLASPFSGTISDVQIAGIPFTPDFESFRYSNYFGDAVSFGDPVSRDAEAVTLAIGTPTEGTELEAGLTDVTGTVSHRAELVATVAGEEVFREAVDAGTFTVSVPVNALGSQELTIRAEADASQSEDSVRLEVVDTVAPARPEVSDNSAEVSGADAEVGLTVAPESDDREALETTFYSNATVPLGSDNTTVRTGSTGDRTPVELTPTSGEVSGELLPTTVGEDENPYQIYEIELTEEQAGESELHFAWAGTGDDRRVSAYVWDHAADAWTLKDTGSNAEGESFELDITASDEDNAISSDNTVSLLVWRGLAEDPFQDSRDYTAEPSKADFDWGFDHIPDTQLYTQATPQLFADQVEYVVDRAEDRNTQLVVHAGDLVNREYLSQEYQFKNAEQGMGQLDEAGLPYLVSWGNHDYSDPRNNRVMLQKYYPTERFEASLEGTPWTFGGSHDIDNYYYTGEVDGAKLLVLTVGFFSADHAEDPGLGWARQVLEDHPDHNVILASHQSVNMGENSWANDHLMDQLIDPFPNVKLVLGGHITGTGVASHIREDGSVVHGILTDYQGRVYGGQEYLRHLSVDAENGILYANTYSPLLDKATSDGNWRQPINPDNVPGFHGTDSENFAIELDLGGSTERTLETGSLSLAVGEPVQLGDPQNSVGAEKIRMPLTGAVPGVEYEWYADLEDAAGHVTRTPVSTFTVTEQNVTAPGEPRDVSASAEDDAVTVAWTQPENDGGAPLTAFEVTVGDQTVTVPEDRLSVELAGFEPGDYPVTVRAQNSAGWSAGSSSVTVTVAEPDDGGGTPLPDASITVSGDFVPGGNVNVAGSGLAANTGYTVELRAVGDSGERRVDEAGVREVGATGFRLAVAVRPDGQPIELGTGTAAADGAFGLDAVLPPSIQPGAYDVVVVQEDADVASARIAVAVGSDGPGGSVGPGGSDGPGNSDGSGDGADGGPGGGAGPGGSAGNGGNAGDVDPTENLNGGTLANTGSNLAWAIGLGVLLILLGTALVILRRRRAHQTQ
ncbi:DUF2341 domain-containing protein [Citricoccus parietis]|uniref:DUF2341 domain-containing protein n=1 Tax=Citricoccus parietis TaxID=592307 RepID=UPI003671D34A